MKPLTLRQLQAVSLLSQTPPLPTEQLAQQIGVSRQKLYKWTKQPDFQTALAQKKRQLLDAALDEQRERVSSLVPKAIAHLERAATRDSPTTASVRAAQLILTMSGLLNAGRPSQAPPSDGQLPTGPIPVVYKTVTTDASSNVVPIVRPRAAQA